jgi:hypothetical protein
MIRVEFSTDNAAFDEARAAGGRPHESAHILREIAARVEAGETGSHNIRDSNGNTCGWYEVYP